MIQFLFCYRWLFRFVFILAVTKMVRMKSEPQVAVSVVPKAQTVKANNSLTQLHDLNAHLNLVNFSDNRRFHPAVFE